MFASKAAFVELGLETARPSSASMYQDCYICKDPLDVNIHTTATDRHHAAIRIGVCGHMHGQECLSAWLDVGNSCPTCKQLLFENSGRISQSDINYVVNTMKRMFGVYGEKRAMAAIARRVKKQEAEQTQQQRIRMEEVKKLKAREAQAQQENSMDGEDWMNDSDAEEDFGEDEDGDYEMGEEDKDETDGSVLSDEDDEPQSAKV